MPQSSDRKTTAQRSRPRRRRQPPHPVLSGWMLLAGALVAAVAFVPFSPLDAKLKPPGPPPVNPALWQVGATFRVPITLVTADYSLLDCASEQTFEPLAGDAPLPVRCAYTAADEKWPREASRPLEMNKENIIQPYSAYPNNDLVLVEGLWAQPAVATRRHTEPARGIEDKKLARFSVECDLTFIGKLQNFELRWKPDQKWGKQESAFVASPKNCEITGAR